MASSDPTSSPARVVGRYALYEEIAAGGMATVHLGRLLGQAGFSCTVAIKQLHPQFAKDPEFVSMFLDEARLAARVRHPNVVSTLDVVARNGELLLVMEYIHGEPLARLQREAAKRDEYIPVDIVVAVMHGVLQGIHAAHEAKSESGQPLDLIHRDVSPQNILVGTDGVPRVLDFGVAKAVGRFQSTRDGQLKGKTAYMAPEQVRCRPVDRRVDIFAAGVVLWEALAGVRLFKADSAGEVMARVLEMPVVPPRRQVTGGKDAIPTELEAVVMRALARDPEQRYPTALDMALALERALSRIPNAREVGDYVRSALGTSLRERERRVQEIESASSSTELPLSSVVRAVQEHHVAQGDVSSISVESSASRPRSRAPGLRAIVIVACALALTGLLWVRLTRRPATADATFGSVPSAATLPPPETSATVPVASSASAPWSDSSSAQVSDGAPRANGTRRVPSPRRPGQSPPKQPASPRSPSPACNPPYTVDPDGVHIPKHECG